MRRSRYSLIGAIVAVNALTPRRPYLASMRARLRLQEASGRAGVGLLVVFLAYQLPEQYPASHTILLWMGWFLFAWNVVWALTAVCEDPSVLRPVRGRRG